MKHVVIYRMNPNALKTFLLDVLLDYSYQSTKKTLAYIWFTTSKRSSPYLIQWGLESLVGQRH